MNNNYYIHYHSLLPVYHHLNALFFLSFTIPIIETKAMEDMIFQDSNSSNHSNDTDTCATSHPGLYIQIMGTVIFVVVWPFIVLDMKCFPLGRPAAALVGAMLMVLFQVVTQSEVYTIEGDMSNLQTIFLLIGMMILSYYFDREGILRIVSLWIIGNNKPFRSILWKVCLLSAGLSAFITNDAACLVITPLLLSEFIKQGRNKKELLPLCLGIATSANIGSAATVFGNPQNAFIASAAKVNLLEFFIAELPAALFGTAISISLLYLCFIRVMLGRYNDSQEEAETNQEASACHISASLAEERDSFALSHDHSDHPFLSSQIARERNHLYRTDNLRRPFYSLPMSRSCHSMPDSQAANQTSLPLHLASNPNLHSFVSVQQPVRTTTENDSNNMTAVEQVEPVNQVHGFKERSWRDKIFFVWLLFISVTVVVLLAVPPPPVVSVEFNLGCIPVAAAISTMLMDTVINRKYAYDAMLKIDWTVILMFMGLFIWLGGFHNTCFPYQLFNVLAPHMNLHRIEGVLLFTVFVIIGSNIFSNVPLVILIVNRIGELQCGNEPCSGPLGGLLLAWVSTVAGNFTLIGSVANLIVAEKARSSADYRLTFWAYLRFGFISTIIVIFSALPIVYFLGRLVTNADL